MPLEDNGGAPAGSMAVGSSLKYFEVVCVWEFKANLMGFFKAQTLGEKVLCWGFLLGCFFFSPSYFSLKNYLFLEREEEYSAASLLCVSTH